MTKMYATAIEHQFASSLQLGTGKAYLILKNNPTVDFSSLIIKGAMTNFAYDPQCEGSRASYIYRLILKSKQKEKIINTILRKLQTKKNDDYGLEQMCDLAVLLFNAGYKEAKNALYNRFDKNSLENYEFCGQSQVMKIGGLTGLFKVAEIIGQKLCTDQDDWEDSVHVDIFQKENKKLSVYSELEKASKHNKFIEAYYRSIVEHKSTISSRGRKRKINLSYDTVSEKINGNIFRFISTKNADELSIDDVKKLANDFLIEKDKQKQILYLRFFGKRQFPFDYQPILKIARSGNPHAIKALKYFSGNDIRQLALKKLNSLKNPYLYLYLLVNNYEKGDYDLLNQVILRSNDYDFIHSLVFGLTEIYESNKSAECYEPLTAIYNKMNCGIHRIDLIKILAENNVLSKEIKEELKFDCNQDVRKFHTLLSKTK